MIGFRQQLKKKQVDIQNGMNLLNLKILDQLWVVYKQLSLKHGIKMILVINILVNQILSILSNGVKAIHLIKYKNLSISFSIKIDSLEYLEYQLNYKIFSTKMMKLKN